MGDSLDNFMDVQRRRVREMLIQGGRRLKTRLNDMTAYEVEVRKAPGSGVLNSGRTEQGETYGEDAIYR